MPFTLNTPLDLKKNEVRNAIAQNLSSAPSSPANGQFYYDSTVPGFRVYINGSWQTLGAGSAAATTGAEGIVQLAGDLGGSGTTAAAPLIGAVSQLVNGVVGTPAVRFAASQSTGIYSSAANTLDLAADGVQVITATGTAITLRQAVTISTGGLTVTAGGLTVNGGGITVAGGGGASSVQALTAAGLITANAGLTVAASQTIDVGANRVTNAATPTASSDLATKNYVDSVSQGLSAKPAARVATNAETLTIASGSVTQITGTTVDGVTVAVNDRILIPNAPAATGAAAGPGYANFTTQPANGLYSVTAVGANITVARDTTMAGTNGPAGSFVFVEGGTAASSGFTVSTPATNTGFTYGTNNVTWTQFSGAGEISAGTGLSKSGNTLSIENSGVLLATHGGTGVASPTAHGVLIAEGASAAVSVTGANSGAPLLSAGSSADPAFGALNLAGGSNIVTGNLPLGNGGTGASTAATARTALQTNAVDTHTITGDSSTTTFTWTPTPTPKTTGAWIVGLVNQTTGAVEYADIAINQSTNAVTVTFATAPATGTNYTAVVLG